MTAIGLSPSVAPSVGFKTPRERIGLPDLTVFYTPGACPISRARQIVMFSPRPVEACRAILRDLDLAANDIRAFTGPGGVIDLRPWPGPRDCEPLARLVGLSAEAINTTLRGVDAHQLGGRQAHG